ncbi:helix-turn-helix domain-containing protein [Paenibacillus koleovorans]|uniref:helix-turn-helix domain-containing protein n=1 Tax=Paenibacillus koleovorans TaxID=121608 RepID=UPI000FD73B62|nr:helix-turn-helix domain-containing protein [Paenibacillus koleovorans]
MKANESFTEAYNRYMMEQIKDSSGERKRKLLDPKRYAEAMFLYQVWWPSFGGFRRLVAEYEVRDFKDGWRYLDFVYVINNVRICIEVDPFGTHFRNIDRHKYDDNLWRHNDLQVDEWKILRFSLDMIKNHPKKCQQTIMSALAKWGLEDAAEHPDLTPAEYRVWKWFCCQDEATSPSKAAKALGMDRKTAAKHLKSISSKGLLLVIASSTGRNMKYRSYSGEK